MILHSSYTKLRTLKRSMLSNLKEQTLRLSLVLVPYRGAFQNQHGSLVIADG